MYFPNKLHCVVQARGGGDEKPLDRHVTVLQQARFIANGSPAQVLRQSAVLYLRSFVSEPERGIGGEATSEYFQSVSNFIKNSSRL